MDGFWDEDDFERANRRALVRFGWILAAALALSLSAPQPLFAATMNAVLAVTAGVVATIALIGFDDVVAPHLTRWDVAAGLYALSLLFGFFVDVRALEAFLLMQRAGVG